MEIFLSGLITTFIALSIAATLLKIPRDYGRFFLAALVFGTLSAIPVPIPLFDLFMPPVGMYMVLIGSNYQSHDQVVKLCVVSFVVIVIFLIALRAVIN